MNCIILSTLFASALIGVSTANPVMQQACALAPLVQQLYGATDQACGTTCLQDPNSQDGCPANACTVAIGVMAAEAAAAQFGQSLGDLINLVNMVMAPQGVSLPANIVQAALGDPTGAGAQARGVLLGFAALLDSIC